MIAMEEKASLWGFPDVGNYHVLVIIHQAHHTSLHCIYHSSTNESVWKYCLSRQERTEKKQSGPIKTRRKKVFIRGLIWPDRLRGTESLQRLFLGNGGTYQRKKGKAFSDCVDKVWKWRGGCTIAVQQRTFQERTSVFAPCCSCCLYHISFSFLLVHGNN